MKPFKYTAPTTERGACELLGDRSLALAGGTSVLNLMKEYVIEPDTLVDVKSIPGLSAIEEIGDGLRIGANVSLTEILESDTIKQGYPALHQALHNTGTPQIRNRGTLGGNLCARPACWYFTHEGFDCLKRGGRTCPAKNGENEYNAIFATDGQCVAVHASSAAPALLALGARVRTVGPNRAQVISLDDFFSAKDPRRENVLAGNEIVTHVMLGAPNQKSATYEVRHKAAHDWPISLAAVSLDMRFGVCQKASVVLGAVAPIPWRAEAAESRLTGNRITEAVAEASATAAVEEAQPLSQNSYKVAATRAAVKRAILIAGTGRWH